MKDLLLVLIAPLVWLAAFSAVYALQGFGCATGMHQTTFAGMPFLRAVLVLGSVITVAIQLGILLWLERIPPTLGWTRHVSRITAWVALVAAIWTLFPVAVTSLCK